MELPPTGARLRPFRADDAAAIAPLMNDRAVWRNLRDRVPHPYDLADAQAFLAGVVGVEPPQVWAIDVDGAAVGAVGLRPRDDVHRRSLEIGFWIGSPFQGRGIVSAAVPRVCAYAFATWPELVRIHAEVFAWNAASARVLGKCGFVREGVLRRAVFKDGELTDLWIFGLLRPA
ncbi:MAG: GNAT family N-acetyltransferase [Planctomycetes bacterium]|nr:GNAT family N-acetyltransferase [Planctomycetota bacterium]